MSAGDAATAYAQAFEKHAQLFEILKQKQHDAAVAETNVLNAEEEMIQARLALLSSLETPTNG